MGILNCLRTAKHRIEFKNQLKKRRIEVNKNGINAIALISKTLNNEGIEPFLDFGTLLGIIRNHGIISWDDDIDMGINVTENYNWNKLEEAMTSLGFKKNHQFAFRGVITEQNYSSNNIFVDFFGHFDVNGRSVSYVYDRLPEERYPSPRHWSVMEHTTPATRRIRLVCENNEYYYIPENASEYLQSVYGDDWMIPNPKWTHHDSPAVTELAGEFSIMETYS